MRFSISLSIASWIFSPVLVEAHQKIDYRGLARSGRPDDRDLLPGLCDCREVVDDHSVGILVAEPHMIEFDCSADLFELFGLADLVEL